MSDPIVSSSARIDLVHLPWRTGYALDILNSDALAAFETTALDTFDSQGLRCSFHSNDSEGILSIDLPCADSTFDDFHNASFELRLGSEVFGVPARPVDIPVGTSARWPINMASNGVVIPWATASLVTVLDSPSGQVVVVAPSSGVPVEIGLAPGSQMVGAPDDAEILRSTTPGQDFSAVRFTPTEPTVLTVAGTKAFTRLLVLPAEAAQQTWVLPEAGAHQLVLATGQVAVDTAGELQLTNFDGIPQAYAFDANVGKFHRLVLDQTHIFERTAVEAVLQGHASASFEIEIPAGNSNPQAVLEIQWDGYEVQLSVDGRVIADHVLDHAPWRTKLSDLNVSAGQTVTLGIVGQPAGAAVPLPSVTVIYPGRATT